MGRLIPILRYMGEDKITLVLMEYMKASAEATCRLLLDTFMSWKLSPF